MERFFTIRVLLFLALCCNFYNTFGNAVTVTSVTRSATGNRNDVSFVLSWQNSWRVQGIPTNYDAVWVFIKYRLCGSTGAWEHALLSTTMGDHTLGPNVAFAENITTTNRLGGGSGHNTGALIRRANYGTGHIVNQACTFRVTGASSGAGTNLSNDPSNEYDIRVIGIEMVMIPQASYLLGSNGTENYKYQIASGDPTPVNVTCESCTLAVYDPICGANRNIMPNFPKGYDKFYVMKYEISQGQYTDFLNTITVVAASQRYPTQNGNYRHSLYVAGGEYVTDKIDRACNYINYNDILTYLDWAALRPMTDVEYEKICRGSGLIAPNGYAWGSNTFVEALRISGTENGTETVLDVNANLHANAGTAPCCAGIDIYCYCNSQAILSGGDVTGSGQTNNAYGPIGCGIFARDTTLTREQTGATYYGVMEMSGNVAETIVTTYNPTTGCGAASPYIGTWGDGNITVGGLFDVTDWPAPANTLPRANGWRGGHWANSQDYCRVADRYGVYWGYNETYNRNNAVGGRGCR
ncbi:MAG: formylglycine-generating enzyme family protein [Bacteroidia bacterium]|nr:formylglycine-generating enzyme family protein [Bacteroidia bacterium]